MATRLGLMLAAADGIVSKAIIGLSSGDMSDMSLSIYWNVTILATFGKDFWEAYKSTTGE